MSKTINNNTPVQPRRHSILIARLVRGLLPSIAVPILLSACAPAPHKPADSATAGGKTVLIVPGKPGEPNAETPAANTTAAAANAAAPSGEFVGPPAPEWLAQAKVAAKLHQTTGGDKLARRYASKFAKWRNEQAESDKDKAKTLVAKVSKDGIWDRVRRRLMLTAYDHEMVLAEVEKIKHSPGHVASISRRAEPFLFYVVDEIDRRGLPMDLAIVPMVESAFEPTAVSPKQAAGIWQFIPGTATENGLRLVEGYDGRYDIYAATKAALKYLSHLQALFGGDWLLALAAYNCGEGAVQRAIQANQKAGLGTSFWDLNLPAETKAYVPKILALSRVIADPAAHGVNLKKISHLPYLARVEVQSLSAPLAQTLTGLGMSWEEFASTNPAFKPDKEPTAPFNLLLPLEKAQLLATTLPTSRLIAARKYVVKKGDTLKVIAKQQGVPALKLAEWNGLSPESRVKPGQELLIYPA